MCRSTESEAVERCEPVDKLSHLAVGGVEDVWPVPVHLYAVHLLTPDIAAKVRPLVDDQAPLASVRSQTGKGGSEQAGAYYQIVI